ncbi:MAG: GerMN domain-containing protein [Oscillospiraceae bacterium]|nr:GerMN domain-containing protein [Oscillospiraceae bacterium]
MIIKNKKALIIVIAALAVAVIAAVVFGIIRRDYNTEKYTGELYFFNESSTSIESESREIRYRNAQDLAENVIIELMKGPSNGKHQRIIERNAELISISGVETGNAVVNFSTEFVTGDNAKDILAVYAVVKSLCAIDNIESVKVVIDGKDIYTSDGSIIGYLTDQDINLPTDTYNSEMREITLYFPDKDGQKLVKEIRSVKITDQQPIAQYIINELIKGPENEELSSVLSSDTVLLSVETSDNICFVNFKSSFLDKNTSSTEKEKMTIYAIVDSLTELDTIQRVQFLMDGKRVDTFGNINIGSMFGRDESIIG